MKYMVMLKFVIVGILLIMGELLMAAYRLVFCEGLDRL